MGRFGSVDLKFEVGDEVVALVGDYRGLFMIGDVGTIISIDYEIDYAEVSFDNIIKMMYFEDIELNRG